MIANWKGGSDKYKGVVLEVRRPGQAGVVWCRGVAVMEGGGGCVPGDAGHFCACACPAYRALSVLLSIGVNSN